MFLRGAGWRGIGRSVRVLGESGVCGAIGLKVLDLGKNGYGLLVLLQGNLIFLTT